MKKNIIFLFLEGNIFVILDWEYWESNFVFSINFSGHDASDQENRRGETAGVEEECEACGFRYRFCKACRCRKR